MNNEPNKSDLEAAEELHRVLSVGILRSVDPIEHDPVVAVAKAIKQKAGPAIQSAAEIVVPPVINFLKKED